MEPLSRFKLYWLMLKRRAYPAAIAFTVVLVGAVSVISLRKPNYSAEGMLRFERTSPTSSLTGVGKEIGNLEPLVEKSSPVTTEAEIIRSAPIIQGTIEKLDLRDRQGMPLKPQQFLRRLTVTEVRGTDILKISYTDADSTIAATVVNTLISVYLEKNALAHRKQAAVARKFLEQELPAAETAVNQVEEALRQFKKDNQVFALEEEATAAVGVLTDLQKQIAAVRSQVADTTAQAQSLQNNLGIDSQKAVTLSILSQAPGVQEVLTQIQQVETQLASERNRFQENHPQIISLEGKRAQLKSVLEKRLAQVPGRQVEVSSDQFQIGALQQDLTKELVLSEAKRQGLIDQLNSLSQSQAAYRQRTDALPGLEKQQRELQRKLEAAQTNYSKLLQKIGEIRVAENQTVGNARVVAPAQASDAPTSLPIFNFLAATVASLLAAAVTVWILETSDRSIKTIEQVKAVFGFTLLGIIPSDQSKTVKNRLLGSLVPETVVGEMLHSPVGASSAAYRTIQSSLRFLSCDRALKVLVITSSVQHEGKSTIATNLALMMAQSGRKVLLVDANMRHPMQHHIWELTNQVGLSDVIAGQAELESAIITVKENLDVLPSGVIPPNSLALLNSQPMAALVQALATQYEYIIIDTPALNLTSDALVVGRLADGILFVVRPEQVDLRSATAAKELLQQSNQNVLGMIMNGIDVQDDPYRIVSQSWIASEQNQPAFEKRKYF